MTASLLVLLAANTVMAMHSPTAWTRGKYTGAEVTAPGVVAYWSFEGPEHDTIVLATDRSGKGHALCEVPQFARYHTIDSVRVLDRAIAFAEPGTTPTVMPRTARNGEMAVAQRQPKPPPETWAKTGVALDLKPRYLSHGRAVAGVVRQPPRIDGVLDDSAWQAAMAYGPFIDNTSQQPEKDSTEFRVCRDAENLYFGVTVFDRNSKLIRRQIPKSKRDGPVYYDDCIEVFLDANGDRNSYYHIGVNANGAIYDSRCGAKTETSWNGVSHAAGSVGQGKWVAEFAIPFRAMGVGDAAKIRAMGFDICREQYSRDGHLLAQWIPCLSADGGFHRPKAFGLLVFDDGIRPQATLATRSMRAEWKDGALLLGLTVRGAPRFQGMARVEFSNRELATWQTVREAVATSGNIRLNIPLGPRWRQCFLRLRLLRKPEQSGLPDDMLVAAFDLPELLKLRLVNPAYRNNIYADQKIDAVTAEVHSALAGAIEVGFGPAGARPTFTRRLASAQKPTRVSIPAADLAEGAYDIVATLFNGTGNPVARRSIVLRKLAVHPNTVRRRADGIWLRRGKPFMPIGWFGLSTRNNGPKIRDLVQTEAINAGVTYMYRKGNEGNVKRLLDDAAKHDVAILIYPFSNTGEKEKGQGRFRLSDAARAEITARVTRFKDHPGLLGWYMADEPEIHDVTVSWMTEMYDLIQTLDPYHPCVVLNDTLPGVYQYAATADISMPDPYIVPMKIGPPSSAMTKIAAFMDAVKAAGNTAWITPEAFNYGFVSERHALARAVTYTEQRCIAFLAMVSGCRGYLYFSLGYSLPEPELRIGQPHVLRELGFVSSILTATGSDLPVQSHKPIRAFARKAGEAFLLVAVNPSMAPAEADLRCTAMPAEMTVLSEHRVVRPKSGSGVLHDRFAPYGVHVYTTLPGADRLPTVEAVKAEIAAYKQRLARENEDNLAFVGKGAVVTAAAYSKAMYLNDGTVNHPNWQFSPKPGKPAWAEVHFKCRKQVSRIVVDATPFQYHDVRTTDLTAYVRLDGTWKRVGSIDNNDKTVISFQFPPVRTDAIRVESATSELVLWAEIRAFPR